VADARAKPTIVPRIRPAALVVPAVALALFTLGAAIVWADLAPDEADTLAPMLTAPRIGLALFFALAIAAVLGILTHRLLAPIRNGAHRIAEAVRLMTHGNPAHRIALHYSVDLAPVAQAVNELADSRSQLQGDVDRAAADAKAGVEEERRRLAALISELDQSVLVCNRDGRVLLYNAAAKALIGGSDAAGAGDLVGLGRSVYGILERPVVMHALEALEREVARESRQSAHFVTATRDGRLLRVRAAPVVGEIAGASPARGLTGYVLLLTDITDTVDADAKRVARFQNLIESTRAALANIRAAIENLTEHPDLDAPRRLRFANVIRDEAVALSERIHRMSTEAAERLEARWPLEEMRGEDLLTLARSRIERRTALATKLDQIDPALWLRVDSFSLAQGLCYIARRLDDEFAVRELRFRLSASGGHAQLDAVWRGPPLSSETAFAWQSEPFSAGGEESSLTLGQVIERHGGEAWYQRDVPSQTAYFRFLLPLAESRATQRVEAEGRPEFYDFDLFRRSPATDALDERALADLAYTVFDTETTGLNPTQGDEIISIGAVRIVNGRLLKGETFSCLVDPQRSLSEASVAVHGITRDALEGQPTIEVALPRFRRFTEETVLVGHNAAFDMRFLQLAEARTGVRFDQPVLDTLLLSAIVHPAQDTHVLDDIAGRLGVDVVDRHTALGDALMTANVFIKLLPLLAERGIRTLGAARAASERTYYARLQY
jgi:DNA polymerase-3 subunit epsilon